MLERAAVQERCGFGELRANVGAVWRRLYVANPACGCPPPVNGQDALDSAVAVPENPHVRVGVDYDGASVVVFHRMCAGEFPEHAGREIFHGRVVGWADLPQPCRQALLEARMVTAAGEIV